VIFFQKKTIAQSLYILTDNEWLYTKLTNLQTGQNYDAYTHRDESQILTKHK